MKKRTIITLYILFAVILITSLIVIDYSVAKIYGNKPIVASKKEDKKNQYMIYSGIFYKMWICTANADAYKVGSYNSEAPECPKVVIFDKNNNFVTDNNIVLSEKNYAMISRYYTYDMINDWKTEEELNDALYISEELYRTVYVTKEGYKVEYNNVSYSVATFYDFILKDDGKYKWEVMTNNKDFHYCLKYDDVEKEFLFSKLSGNTCDGNFEKLKVADNLCETISKSVVSDLIKLSYDKFCK